MGLPSVRIRLQFCDFYITPLDTLNSPSFEAFLDPPLYYNDGIHLAFMLVADAVVYNISTDASIMVVSIMKRMDQSIYYCGCAIQGFSTTDKCPRTFMKLYLNIRDLDLADRFNISRTIVSKNIVIACNEGLCEIFSKE